MKPSFCPTAVASTESCGIFRHAGSRQATGESEMIQLSPGWIFLPSLHFFASSHFLRLGTAPSSINTACIGNGCIILNLRKIELERTERLWDWRFCTELATGVPSISWAQGADFTLAPPPGADQCLKGGQRASRASVQLPLTPFCKQNGSDLCPSNSNFSPYQFSIRK